MSQLLVRLLGPPTVEWEGGFLPVPRRKVRALFFRLALDMHPVSREHLTYLLWSEAHRRMVAARLAGGDMDEVRRIMEACRGLVDLPHLALADRRHDK